MRDVDGYYCCTTGAHCCLLHLFSTKENVVPNRLLTWPSSSMFSSRAAHRAQPASVASSSGAGDGKNSSSSITRGIAWRDGDNGVSGWLVFCSRQALAWHMS